MRKPETSQEQLGPSKFALEELGLEVPRASCQAEKMNTSVVLALEERLRLAMLQSDVAELDELLSPKLLFTTFLGQVISKEDDIDAHGTGYFQMHSIELSEQHVQILGRTAVVTCLAEIDATFDRERTKRLFRFTRVWRAKKNKAPRVIVGQATLVYSALAEDD